MRRCKLSPAKTGPYTLRCSTSATKCTGYHSATSTKLARCDTELSLCPSHLHLSCSLWHTGCDAASEQPPVLDSMRMQVCKHCVSQSLAFAHMCCPCLALMPCFGAARGAERRPMQQQQAVALLLLRHHVQTAVTGLQIAMEHMTTKWTTLALDMHELMAQTSTNPFKCIKSLQFCANMQVRGAFASDSKCVSCRVSAPLMTTKMWDHKLYVR